MKMRMCTCRWSALARPDGPIKVVKTEMKGDNVLVARLDGAVKGQAAVVKHKKKFYFVPPKGYGATREVPADYLTDGLHTAVFNLEMDLKGKAPAAGGAPAASVVSAAAQKKAAKK